MARHHQKSDIDLQRRVGQCAQKLQLRVLFHWHQIEDADLQWPDILMQRTVLIHHKYILVLQYLLRRQVALYFNRHVSTLLSVYFL